LAYVTNSPTPKSIHHPVYTLNKASFVIREDNNVQLLTNLTNTSKTLGSASPQYKTIHKTILLHMSEMSALGQKTDITGLKKLQREEANVLVAAFEGLGVGS
jgi:hypothetical protein